MILAIFYFEQLNDILPCFSFVTVLIFQEIIRSLFVLQVSFFIQSLVFKSGFNFNFKAEKGSTFCKAEPFCVLAVLVLAHFLAGDL